MIPWPKCLTIREHLCFLTNSNLRCFLSFLFAGCGELLSVSEPVTHRKADNIAGKYGIWMQDPEAVSPYGPNMLWRIDAIGAEVKQMFGYEDLEQLSKGFPSKAGVTWLMFRMEHIFDLN